MTMHESILAPDLNLIRQHLDAWSAPYIGTEYEDGLCEIAFTAPDGAAPDRARMFALDDLETAATFAADQNAKGANIYIGAALRAPDANPKGRGSSPDFYAAAFACCEADEHADTVAERIEAAGLKGAIRVRTGQHPGKRVHHWLPLRELCDDAEGYTEALRALVAHVGADAKVKDAARVLRLGGSVNWITDPTKKAKGYVDELTVIKTEEAPAADLDRLARLEPLPGWNPSAGGGRGGNGGPGEIVRNAAGIVTDGREAFWRQIVIAELAKYQRATGADPSAEELFEAAFPRFEKETEGDDRWTSERGQRELRKRVQNTWRRLCLGHLARHGLYSIETEAGREEAEEAQKKRVQKRRDTDDPPKGFRIKADGIYHETEKDGEAEWSWLCSPIRVLALTRGTDSKGWGRLVEITDPDGNRHRWAAPATLFAGDGASLLSECFRLGLRLSTSRAARAKFTTLLQQWSPKTRATSSERLGWADGSCRAFILGDGRVIGDESVVYQSENVPGAATEIHAAGTLDDWRNQIAAACVGNPLMVTATSLAFAGVLLEPLKLEGGGLHLRGASSRGKTTVLQVAVSVWGSPRFLQTWRATSNGLEGVATACNGTLIALDEMGEISGREAGATAYMLANGRGKARADRSGAARKSAEWRTALLSSGELTLADKMNEAGQRARAGQAVRLLDLKADARTFGAFDDLHGQTAPANFADGLKKACAANYGLAGPEFVRHVIGDLDHVTRQARAFSDRFVQTARERLDLGDEGQTSRAAARFGLIAAGGELATAWSLTGWTPGTALEAALDVFAGWIRARGGSTPAEAREAIERVRAFIAQHGGSRFETIVEDGGFDTSGGVRVINRAGWRQGDSYLISADAWREIHAGADASEAARYLRDAQYLTPGEGRNLAQKAPRTVRGRPRVYVVAADILGGGDE